MDKDTWVITDGEDYVAVVRERRPGVFAITLSLKNPRPSRGREGYPDYFFHLFEVNIEMEFSGGEATFSLSPTTWITLDDPQVYEDLVAEGSEIKRVPLFTYTYRELVEHLTNPSRRTGKSPIVNMLEQLVRRINNINFAPSSWEYDAVWESYERTIRYKMSSVIERFFHYLPEGVRVSLSKGHMSFKGTVPSFELSSVSFTGNEFQVTLKAQPSKIKLSIPLMVNIPVDLLMENPKALDEIRLTLRNIFSSPEVLEDISKWFVEVYLPSVISGYLKEYFVKSPDWNLITNALLSFVRRKLSEKGLELSESKVREITHVLSRYALNLIDNYEVGRSFKVLSGSVSVVDTSVDSPDYQVDVVGKPHRKPSTIPGWAKHYYEYTDLIYVVGETFYFGDKTTDYTSFIVFFEVQGDTTPIKDFFSKLEEERPDIRGFLMSVSLIAERIYSSSRQIPFYVDPVAERKVVDIGTVLDWINDNLRKEGEQE